MKYDKKNIGALKSTIAWAKMKYTEKTGKTVPQKVVEEEIKLVSMFFPRLKAQFEGISDPDWVAKMLPNYKPDDYLPPMGF